MTMIVDWSAVPSRLLAKARILVVVLPILSGVLGCGYFLVSKASEGAVWVTSITDDLRSIHSAIQALDSLGVGRDREIAAVKADVASHDGELRETHEAVKRVETLSRDTNNQLTALMTQLLGKSRSASSGR